MNNTYKKEGNKVTFQFNFNQSIIDSIKEIDYKERSYDQISKCWKVNLSITNQSKVFAIIKKHGFELLNSVNKPSNEEDSINLYIEKKSRLNLVKSYKTEIDKIQSKLRPYKFQELGVDMMCSWPKMINGDDMGLGKSVETIYSAEIMNRFPCLLVCPLSVKYQWKELWLKINPKRTISIIEAGSKINEWDADVVIINYNILGTKNKYIDEEGEEKWNAKSKYSELLTNKWDYMVFDEIHFLKNYKSLRSKSAQLISKRIKNVHGLTGTLIENRPIDLMNPLMLINVFSEIFGNWNSFTDRYCDAKETRFGMDYSGHSNMIELNKLLRATCYLRREKREVLKDLPPIQHSMLHIELTNMKEYQRAEDEFIEYLEENFSKAVVDSAMMAQFLVQRNHLRQLSLKGKLKGIISWLEEYCEQTKEKALVVANYKQPLKELAEHFESRLIDGDMDGLQKRAAVKNWSTNDKQLIFGNITAIGTGTDGLQDNCSTLVVLDLPDKSTTLDQLVSRIERIGVKNAINVYMLMNRETIDSKLWEAIEMKREVTEAINKGKEFKSVDIDTMIAKSYLNKNK